MRITVVIPTYNEVENLPVLVDAIFALGLDELWILVVDDNSPDGTGQVADQLAQRRAGKLEVIHRSGKQGLGTAYITGFRRALDNRAQLVAQMDADFSHPVELLPSMLSALDYNDVVIGSRYVSGGAVDRHWPAWRKGLSAFGNFYARTILRLPIRDLTSGYKIWKRDVLLSMPLERIQSNGYAFQIETSYIAHCLGFTFKEVPFYFADRKWGLSKMSFGIQREAAIRVWQLLFEYRDLKESHSHLRH